MNELRLRKGEERRLRVGHLWVFSNEIDTGATPLKGLEPGSPVRIMDSRGGAVGVGYVNPATLIACRVLSRNPDAVPDRAFVKERMERALRLREGLFPTPHYRLIHGEADYLPGLVVDRFGDVLSVQLNTAGMDRLAEEIVSALDELLAPRAVLLRNDSAARELEGLNREVTAAFGDIPEEIEAVEDGVRFVAPFAGGQKTGFYYDMREIRLRAADMAGRMGADMVDCFSYVGALGVRAALNGARRVICVDSSETAMHYAAENARLNGVGDRVEILRGDAFERLAGLESEGFGFVSVDPPAFIKRRKDAREGARAYGRINELAARLVSDGGFLLGCSCSQHFDAPELRRTMAASVKRAGAWPQVVWQGHQAQDHPVHPAMVETEYLKGFCCRVNRIR